MSEYKCAFCKERPVPDEDHICDKCFKDEKEANERDEAYANWHNEQVRIRYKDINLFDNGVGTISIVYRRKKIVQWPYNGEGRTIFGDGRLDVMQLAKGYIEGWLDAK